MTSTNQVPTIFISYSWDSEEHKDWVLQLSDNLYANGIRVILDRYTLRAGKHISSFVENAISKSDKVIIIFTPGYKLKADKREGGVGYEYSIINNELYQNITTQKKIIPILKTGSSHESIPQFMQQLIHINFTKEDEFNKSYTELLREIYDEPEIKQPVIGTKPQFKLGEYVQKQLPAVQVDSITLKERWGKSVDIIKDNVNWRAYITWIEPISAHSFLANTLYLTVPNTFFKEWLNEHYKELLEKATNAVFGNGTLIEYRISDSFIVEQQDIYVPSIFKGFKIDPQLNLKYTFDIFVEGNSNRVARSAGLHVAGKPGATSFNPLVIFGNIGCGKTHLVQAIGNEAARLHPNKNVLYVGAEKFVNQLLDHQQDDEISDFLKFYELIDILILDDIHLLPSSPEVQDIFYAIYNHLLQNGKQIIITSNVAPKFINELPERIKNHLLSGLSAAIDPPGYEMRIRILEGKARREGVDFSKDVMRYIALDIKDIRKLEAAIIAISAQSILNKEEVNIELAEKVLSKL